MTDPIGVVTPDELRAAQRRILDSELRAHCKLIADNLAASIEMARERGEQPDAAEVKLALVCDYEATFARRVHGRAMPRDEPRWPSRKEEAA